MPGIISGVTWNGKSTRASSGSECLLPGTIQVSTGFLTLFTCLLATQAISELRQAYGAELVLIVLILSMIISALPR